MPPNTDRPINRANGCGMCCFCHAQPFEITRAEKIKSTLLQHSRQTRKLWKHSAMRLAAFRTNAAHQFTNRPLMNSVCPPRCPLHSPGLTCMRACTSPRAGRRVHHRDRHQHTIPIALAALPGAHTSRDFVPCAFRTPAAAARDSLVMPASENLHSNGSDQTQSITSSARRRRAGGIWMPKDRAVAELMTNSNAVGCSIGRSLGFAPFKMSAA